MRLHRRFGRVLMPIIVSAALASLAAPALAQERALAFSVTGGVSAGPKYFGADSTRIGPGVGFGFGGVRLGRVVLGDPDGPTQFAPGTGLRGSFRNISKREGKNELAGLEDVKASLELGLGLHHTAENWQVFADLRYGAIGHKGIAGALGANAIYRGSGGLVLHGGPRASFGNARFARSYFGITAAEAAAAPNFPAAYRPSGGIHAIGLEVGAYQPLNDDWGVAAKLRYDRLRGDAGRSPIVQQGSRDQFSASIRLTRHFNFRF